MTRPALVALLALQPAAMQAEPYLTDTAYCDEPVPAAYEAGVMSLFPTGTETIEYYCTWTDTVDLTGTGDDGATRLGHCGAPGEIFPMVFTLFSGWEGEGTVAVFHSDGDGTPQLFYDCALQ